ncbi:MAG: type II secretion system protein [Oscillospiraceae bacterium]
MKSRKLKGFTLIECIVAMALIGITSLLMVQVYGTIAKMNQDNNRINNSLEKQMEIVENELKTNNGDSAVTVTRITSYDGTVATKCDQITFTRSNTGMGLKFTQTPLKSEADIDMYVIGINGSTTDEYVVDSSGKTLDNNTVRYKFILPSPEDNKES